MRLRPDTLAEELERLAPEIVVRGGSFAHWLPKPREVSQSERRSLLLATRSEAIGMCLTDLLASVGAPAVEPPRLPWGSRSWPEGYTGSVSKSGTNVVAAIAPADRMKSIGIDIERQDGKGFLAIEGLDAREQPFAVPERAGQLALFSVKEAVFKTLHPVCRAPLDFAEIALSWAPSESARGSGVARAFGVTLGIRCSIAIPTWVVSAALWPTSGSLAKILPTNV